MIGGVTSAVVWSAIVLTGLIFGLIHLPGVVAAGAKLTRPLILTAIVLNLWVSLFCGWLFWQYGLLAAILAHMLVHVFWYPFDKRFAKPI